ncbi:MAG: hypothetical protein J6T48_10555 [Bacteroidales bacterium]|nr:hypothetical protein [Bacteroidales bacterium]
MSSSSIISAIKSAILTETQSSVKIHERSLWSVIVEYNRNGKHDSWKEFNFKSYKGKSLVITRHILRAAYLVPLLFICVIYGIISLIHKLVTGKWRNRNKSSSGINIFIVSVVLVVAIIIIAYILTFFIKDVVFHPNRAYINRKGVVTVEQPCYETQSFFLLNSATAWTSTGIQISEGDVVYITASGSMYSDIDDLYFNCKKNHKTNFDRVLYNAHSHSFADKVNEIGGRMGHGYNIVNRKSYLGNYDFFYSNIEIIEWFKKYISKEPDEDVKYCMYGRNDKEEDAFFGSLLYQIHPECQDGAIFNESDSTIKQIDFKNPIEKKLFKDNRFHFNADADGVLFLSFNDIYLDSEICKRIRKDCAQEPGLYVKLFKKYVFSRIYERFQEFENDSDNPNSCIKIFENYIIPDSTENLRCPEKSISYIKLFENEIDTSNVMFDLKDGSAIFKRDTIKYKKEKLNPEIWFNDNLGEILVNVRIEKNLDNLKWYKRCFASLYRNMDHIVQRGVMSTNLPLFLYFIIMYFIIDILASQCYKQSDWNFIDSKLAVKMSMLIKRIKRKINKRIAL